MTDEATPRAKAPRRDGVVLLHALARRPQSMGRLARALEAAGFKTIAPAYPSRRATVMDCARAIAGDVQTFAASLSRVHFVGHSMGGLVARASIAQARPQRLGRVVTLGTPHGGSEIIDLLGGLAPFRAFYGPVCDELGTRAAPALSARLGAVDYPLGSIAGTRALNLIAAWFVLPRPNDGTVSVAATKVEGMTDHRAIGCDHFTLPQHAQAIALSLAFLASGRFTPP